MGDSELPSALPPASKSCPFSSLREVELCWLESKVKPWPGSASSARGTKDWAVRGQPLLLPSAHKLHITCTLIPQVLCPYPVGILKYRRIKCARELWTAPAEQLSDVGSCKNHFVQADAPNAGTG